MSCILLLRLLCKIFLRITFVLRINTIQQFSRFGCTVCSLESFTFESIQEEISSHYFNHQIIAEEFKIIG